MKKVLVITISVLITAGIIIGAAYAVDTIRMSEGKDVIFSAWGNTYTSDSDSAGSDSADSGKTDLQEISLPVSDSSAAYQDETGTSSEAEYVDTMLYFADGNIMNLVYESRSIKKSDSVEESIVQAIIDGPDNPELVSLIPEGTKINSAECDDSGLCIVDLSSEFCNFESMGSTMEYMAIMSIVNTLCELDSINEVKIDIDGNSSAALGHYLLDKPYKADLTLIQP